MARTRFPPAESLRTISLSSSVPSVDAHPRALGTARDGHGLRDIWNRSRNSALAAREIRLDGEAMRTTEVHLPDENDLAGRLTDMRIWLDKHRYEPSTFTYFFLDPGMKICVAFKLAAEAEVFAQEFNWLG
jgi:hypothetical protein